MKAAQSSRVLLQRAVGCVVNVFMPADHHRRAIAQVLGTRQLQLSTHRPDLLLLLALASTSLTSRVHAMVPAEISTAVRV